jgi:mannose-1-phosphate guanylyltransferase
MIHAIILAGGWGRRFWPQSRRKLPKQLLNLGHRHSSIQMLLNIIKSEISQERIWVVANRKYVHSLRKHLPFLSKRNFLVEPEPKNTASAVGLASIVVRKVDPQAVTVVLSSDHILRQKSRFLQIIRKACIFAESDNVLVTIGIRPRSPETGYGYLKIIKNSKLRIEHGKIYKVEKFIEKPTLPKAKMYVKNGNYLWNSGIFVWQVNNIIKAIKKHLPKTYAGLQRIEKVLWLPQYENRLAKEYHRFKDISIDFGIMEKAVNIYTVVGEFPWADIGSWNSLYSDFYLKDNQDNAVYGLHKGIDTYNSVIFSQNKHLIATLGIRDLIIVHTPTATLVCKRNQAQKVKELTELLEKDKRLRKYL